MKKRLAIVVTHPIQYYAPVFKLLAERGNIELKVFYTWGEEGIKPKYDPGFGKKIEWDIPLLEGYWYEFLINTAKDPGSHHFKGIQNPDIIERIKEFQPSAILIYGWSYSSHLKVIRHFKGKTPIWFRGDSTLLNEQPGLKKSIRRVFLKLIYSYIDKAFYVGTANKYYFEKHGLHQNQLIFAPHATDNSRFEMERTKEAKELRAGFGIPQDAILILFAGKFDLVKNPLLLLNAFIDLNLPDVYLLFVGNGILEEALKSKVNDQNLERVHFMDFQNQSYLPVIYQACDLFCLPSKSETWGLAINEVMAAGKSVLVSDQVGCSADLVKDGINGYIFKSGDQNDLKDKLKKQCFNKETLAEQGYRSLEIVKNWSFITQVKAIEDELKYD